jgi:hypothetical protein
MKYEWDDQKNSRNFHKHGVWFEEAQTIWADRLAVEFFDSTHSEKEERFLRIGTSTSARILLVVFCERVDDVVRIISARKATAKERRQYEEAI